MRLNILAIFLIFSAGVLTAQTFNMNLDQQTASWQVCTNPGGQGTPIATTITPKTNGLEFSLKGPAYTDALFCDKTFPETSANSFQSDFWVTIDSLKNVQALEYDMGVFNPPTEFMFGTECVIGEYWQVWNGLTGNWENTAVKCNITTGRHHIQEWSHRIGTTMYFDEIGVDQLYYAIGMSEPAGPEPDNWPGFAVIQFQLDTSDVTGDVTISEKVEDVNFMELY